MEKQIDKKSIQKSIKALAYHIYLNDYASERVVFGYEKPGDKAPVDLYMKHLGIKANDIPCKDIPGLFINKQECINADMDYSEYVRDLFVMKMENIFYDAPKDARLDLADEDIPLLPRFRDYIYGLLPLFTEVMNTEVEYDAFDVIPSKPKFYSEWRKLVTDILIKSMKSGKKINRYVKDLDDAPIYIYRLIEKDNNEYFLNFDGIDSYEYKFALFSLIKFMNGENAKIFELKMHEWERRYNSISL